MRITAAGSLPGKDFVGALTAMAELCPDLTPLPELPARGIGADMIGRALGLIDQLSFDVDTAGWRLTHHSGREHHAAQALWRSDLDDMEEALQSFEGTLKVAVAGPWTLASAVERPTGDRLLADHGARREVAEAVTEAVDVLQREMSRRLPDATVRVQIDEPGLVAVRTGQVPTASGFSRHRSVDDDQLIHALAPFRHTILHCCADGRWLDVAARAGFQSAYVDASLSSIDELGGWTDAGRELVLGVIDTSEMTPVGVDAIIGAAKRVTREIGVSDDFILAPACGLAGWKTEDASRQLRDLRRAAELLDAERA